MIIYKFACEDVGVDCNFIAAGKTVEEVKKKAFDHAGGAHADIIRGMTDAQKAEVTRTVTASIRSA